MSTTTGHLVEAMDGASLAEAGRPAWGFVRDVLPENSGAVHVEDRVEDVAEFGSVRKKVNDWISATGRG